MTDLERHLRYDLPRPTADERFGRSLLGRILSEGSKLYILEQTPDGDRRKLVVVSYVGGAVLGAAAIAVSAALGWRRGRAATHRAG